MIDKILDKLALKEKSFLSNEIFAPYIKGGNKVVVRIDGVVYKLNVPKAIKDGFGVFKAKDPNNAKFVREAENYEIDQYLQLLPKVEAILIYNLGRWLATPVNDNAFKQRFGESQLFNVLVADNVEMLDTVLVRFDGVNFWFESSKMANNADKREILRQRVLKHNYSLTEDLEAGLTPEEIKAFNFACQFHKEASMSDLEKKLTSEFTKYNATMERFIERGENVEVQWRDNSNQKAITSVLKKNDLSIVTAGICLSGGDKKFDLQSMVSVFRESNRRGATVYVGAGGMEDDRYWEMYGDRNDDSDWDD